MKVESVGIRLYSPKPIEQKRGVRGPSLVQNISINPVSDGACNRARALGQRNRISPLIKMVKTSNSAGILVEQAEAIYVIRLGSVWCCLNKHLIQNRIRVDLELGRTSGISERHPLIFR